jgi:single-stranded-DNA-specific exonuclease
MEYIWQNKEIKDPKLVQSLAEQLHVSEVIAQLLVERDVQNYEEAANFFRPKLSHIHDPFLMEDMDIAVERLTNALAQRQKIMVYGDYDVDGSTSVALMVLFLKKLNADFIFYQPDRYDEGYGISFKGIEKAKDENIQLIIALDCGTRAIDKIELANSYNIDVIVCDHHAPGEVLPAAFAMLNPKKVTCNYPFKELCGCGIGFKLIQAFAINQGWDLEDILEYLDLVTIAIGADIVPLNGENRTLAYFGLEQINNNPRLGVKKLLETNNKTKNITISDLVFTIAPRINAAGRISHANAAVEMLLVEDEEEAINWCTKINNYNTERRELDKDITEDALLKVKTDAFYRNSNSTVVWDKSWHKGVVGIVASRLIENYYKPTIVLTIHEGEATGSARSVKGFDVLEAITACSDLLTKFGGHKYAAGLSLKEENLTAFRQKFEDYVAATITNDLLEPKIKVDATITSEELALDIIGNPLPKLYRICEQFAPFGPHNMRPVFRMNQLTDTGYSKIVGESHIKFALRCPLTQKIYNGIGFGLGHKLDVLKSNKPIDIVFNLEINEYMGNIDLQFNVKDFNLS